MSFNDDTTPAPSHPSGRPGIISASWLLLEATHPLLSPVPPHQGWHSPKSLSIPAPTAWSGSAPIQAI